MTTGAFAQYAVALTAGSRLYVSGGAGGVGCHAVQLAKKVYGVGEVATTVSMGKMEFVRRMGADVCVDYKKEDVKELLKGWADAALDTTGEPAGAVVKDGGKIVSMVRPIDGVFVMLRSNATLMKRVAKAIEDGKLDVVIDKVYPLEDGLDAIRHVAGGRSTGKVVIKVC